LEHRGHLFGREITLALHDFVTGCVENDCSGPTVVFVAIRKIGAGILVYANGEIVFVEEREDFRVTVGGDVHDVAPVTPHGFEIEQNETVVAAGLGEDGVGPGEPCRRWRSRVHGG
jgi:hypothetical protein